MAALIGVGISLASAGVGAYQAHEAKEDELERIDKQSAIDKKSIQERSKDVLAQQKASFAASGISLTSGGTAQSFFDETKTATAEDMALVGDYYNSQISSLNKQTRGQYIRSMGQVVNSVYSYSSTAKAKVN